MPTPPKTLSELIKVLGGKAVGSTDGAITGVASLSTACYSDLAFYEGTASDVLLACNAGVVLVNERNASNVKNTAWVVDNPRLVFARAATIFSPADNIKKGIAPTAVICNTASLGKNVSVGHYVSIGKNVVIGDGCQIHDHVVMGHNTIVGPNTIIYPHVVLYASTRIGKNCIIHSGVVMGADGFGFVAGAAGYEKIPQLGAVVIGDGVDVGANTAIDCGTLDDTVIADGVKIDNLVQIGHNVQIGQNSIICGCVGIAGSTIIGKDCMIGGACSIGGHLIIEDDVQIAGASSVNKNVKTGSRLSSQMPALPIRQWQRLVVLFKRNAINNKLSGG